MNLPQEIYAALIEQAAEDWPYMVVWDHTRPFRGITHFNPEEYPTLQHETYENFMIVNQEQHPLEISLDLGLPYKLLSDQDWKEMQDTGGYEAFYTAFPDAPGIIEFSGIGPNEQQDQALASWGRMWGIRAGRGYLQMLERQSGRWVVVETLMSWVS
jgi:hypothetical protein